MRNWLHGGDLDVTAGSEANASSKDKEEREKNRVVVVHCKAGKGRSGTTACSYLISEEGWKPEDALARFTSRRMRPQFGAGVSIPSQLRWVSYVDRWTGGGKKYIDRPIEILEIHIWGLRNGVKVDVEGFEDEGKSIRGFHTFKKEERLVVEGDAPEGGGLSDMMWDLAGYTVSSKDKAPEEAALSEGTNNDQGENKKVPGSLKRKSTSLIKAASTPRVDAKSKTFAEHGSTTPLGDSPSSSSSSENEPGGKAVILRPCIPIIIPNSDINISVERRNRTRKSLGMTMVTAVGHVWFNAYFEGSGPEQGNKPSDSGVFSIDWEAMDGIKGTSRKGGRALDRMAVVWRAAGGESGGEEVDEPDEGAPVPQTKAADWKGAALDTEKNLGLRTQSPASTEISRASSVKSLDAVMGATPAKDKDSHTDGTELAGVKSSGPGGEGLLDDDVKGKSKVNEDYVEKDTDEEIPKSG